MQKIKYKILNWEESNEISKINKYFYSNKTIDIILYNKKYNCRMPNILFNIKEKEYGILIPRSSRVEFKILKYKQDNKIFLNINKIEGTILEVLNNTSIKWMDNTYSI